MTFERQLRIPPNVRVPDGLPAGLVSSQALRPELVKTANYTVLDSDNSTTFIATAVDVVFQLPPTQAGLRYVFIAKAPSGGVGVSVSPAAVDKIMGNGFVSLDNKDAINSGATDREGDIIELEGDGLDGWYIVDIIGVWAREA